MSPGLVDDRDSSNGPAPVAALRRRAFLQRLFLGAGAAAVPGVLVAASPGGGASFRGAAAPAAERPAAWAAIGPLLPPDAHGLRLPPGWRSRVVAVSGEAPVSSSSYRWHPRPDGGATFAMADGGWVYVNNSEMPGTGGVGVLRFNAAGEVVDAYPILAGTHMNCAGGPTPWGTWLSCEEYDLGQVHECSPQGRPQEARARPALGIFKHEAVAVDPARRMLYLTEDERDGRFYRFVCSPQDWPDGANRPALADGRLQVLTFTELGDNRAPPDDFDVTRPRPVRWVDVLDAKAAQAAQRKSLGARAPGSVFVGGEGVWHFAGIVYFATKGDDRIWAYDHAAQTIEAIYDFATADAARRVLSGVDNLTVSPWGEVLVAEDGGNMELCRIDHGRHVRPVLQVVGQDSSELTGPAFSPDGKRLYVNSQRGGRRGEGRGITYEVSWG